MTFVGQPCEIVLDAFPDRRFRGEVSTVVPTVNRASATVTTKVRILDPDSSILPDMSARVSFLSSAVPEKDNKPVAAVSPQALVKRGDRTVVYAIGDDGRARAEVDMAQVLAAATDGLAGVRVSINDMGATPAVVSLRLDQAVADSVLAKAHDLRNLAEYEGHMDVDQRLVDALLAACKATLEAINLAFGEN